MIFDAPIVNSDVKVPNKHVYRIITTGKLYNPKSLKDAVKRVMYK